MRMLRAGVAHSRIGAEWSAGVGASRVVESAGRRSPRCWSSARSPSEGGRDPDAGAPPRAPARHRALRRLRHARDRPAHLAFAPAVSALDRRRRQAAVDLAAARHRDRRLRPRRLGFPVGTRFWKEFSFAGRRVETRYIERAARRAWLYAAYEWSADGRDGRARARSGAGAAPSPSAAGGRTRSRRQRLPGLPRGAAARRCSASACSSSRPTAIPARCTPSRGRRPASTSPISSRAGLLVGLPERCSRPRRGSPRERRSSGRRSATCTATAATATTPTARCASRALPAPRHRGGGASRGARRRSGQPSTIPPRASRRTRCSGSTPGHPERSALAERMGSRWAALQMPPLGTELGRRARRSNWSAQWIAELDGEHSRRPNEGGSEEDDTQPQD